METSKSIYIKQNYFTVFIFATLAAIMAVFISSAQIIGDVDTDPDNACLKLTYNLKYRSKDVSTNSEVSDLQDFLSDKGYLSDSNRGYFGVKTLKAVKAFQSANSLLASGYVGPMTRGKISAMTCNIIVSNSINSTTTSQAIQNVPFINNVSLVAPNSSNGQRAMVVVDGMNLSKVQSLNWTWCCNSITGSISDISSVDNNRAVFFLYSADNLLNKLKLTDISKSSLYLNVSEESGKISNSFKVDLDSLLIDGKYKQNIELKLINTQNSISNGSIFKATGSGLEGVPLYFYPMENMPNSNIPVAVASGYNKDFETGQLIYVYRDFNLTTKYGTFPELKPGPYRVRAENLLATGGYNYSNYLNVTITEKDNTLVKNPDFCMFLPYAQCPSKSIPSGPYLK